MLDSGERSLEVAEVERAVRVAEPTAWVVPHRILRRVIKRDRGLSAYGLQVPHRLVYTISGETLSTIVAPSELGIRSPGPLPPTVILIARPLPEELARIPRRVALTDYWRRLFHARVHAALDERVSGWNNVEAETRERVAAIGPMEFLEIRTVLRQEGMLLPPDDELTVYLEFAAYYLELRHFSPSLIPHTFPGLGDPAVIDALLRADVDDAALLASTRLAGAPDPDLGAEPLNLEGPDREPDSPSFVAAAEEAVERAPRRLIRRASAAAGRGNLVRAAILRTQAARCSPPSLAGAFRSRAGEELEKLVRRLQQALGFDDVEAEVWSKTLPQLLDRASKGYWTPEARLLYDLQKVCVDHEREVFRIDLVGWLFSGFRRPIRRVQPYLREAMGANHLRVAAGRTRSVRVTGEDLGRLDVLLRTAVERSERTLRDRLREPIDATLTSNGVRPANLPEIVAYEKLIDELLDRIAGSGFLSISDLRDACSRSDLKLPDLSGPREFLRGDRLLQVDRALALALDGVYRRGEVYLRGLQRASSLAFGTPWGRFLSLFVALPYGGAFVVLEGLQHLSELVLHLAGGGHVQIRNTTSLLLLGTVALGAVNFLSFRHRFLIAMRAMGRVVRLLLFDTIAWLLQRPLFRIVFTGRLATIAWQYVLKPSVIAVPSAVLAEAFGAGDMLALAVGGLTLLATNLLINSRTGRIVEEILVDEAVRTWRQLFQDLIPGLFRLVMATFDAILEAVDRLLYAGDEWLRFRTGQTRLTLGVKVVLGAFWSCIAYLVRIYVNLLIEPQVNPIKHFPVVTVSHKVILPFSLVLTKILAAPLLPLGRVFAEFVAWTTVLLLPGVFGFLVWELKANWRLYEANRHEFLGKVIVGTHGETVGRLLRPGFHSGTLPKLFAKLRKSERRRLREGNEKAVLKHLEALHHVTHALERFIERDFLALVHRSRVLGPLGIEAGHPTVSTNRIALSFSIPGHDRSLRIVFEERSGRLIATVVEAGWLPGVTDAQRRAVLVAVVGLDTLSGIEWIREPARGDGDPPTSSHGGRAAEPTLVSFQDVTIPWDRWVETWERDRAGLGHLRRFVVGLPILPAPSLARGKRGRPTRR